jgi:hypothetical protein
MNVPTTQKTIYNNQHDTWRRLYIKLLTSELEPWDGWSADRIALEGGAIEDLIVAGYLGGKVTRDAAGVIAFVVSSGPTLAGRLFAEEQQDILDKKSLWGRIKSGTGLFVGWVVGIISALIVWRLTK